MHKTSEKISMGIVGCGYWGPNLIRNFLNNKNCGQVICCDLDQTKLEQMHGRYPSLKLTPHYQDLVGSNQVDAVAIATPVNTHFQLARDLASNGRNKTHNLLLYKKNGKLSKQKSGVGRQLTILCWRKLWK